MGFLTRAKKPNVPDAAGYSGGAAPMLGADPNALDWIWGALDAGMVNGTVPSWAALPITESEIIAIPAVTGSLSLLVTFALQMPLEAVRDNEVPPEIVEPTPAVLVNPTGDPRATNVTLADWLEGYVRDVALYGNFLAVLGDPGWDGWPRIMYPVPVGYWEVFRENGVRRYRIGADEYDPADIFHVAINRRTGDLVGRGLLNTNRSAINAACMAERWAVRYFESGTAPSIHISHPNPDLTQAQADDLKNKFVQSQTGTRAPVITPTGTTIDVLPNDAEKAQLIEARKWSNQALAIALGVPPAMLGLEQPSMTYRNIAEVNQQVISTTEMRYLLPLCQQLTAQCLPRGMRARFNPSALSKPDFAERMTQALAGVAGGLLSVDEGRAMIDYPSAAEMAEPDQGGQDANAPTEAPPTDATAPLGMQPLVAVGGGAL